MFIGIYYTWLLKNDYIHIMINTNKDKERERKKYIYTQCTHFHKQSNVLLICKISLCTNYIIQSQSLITFPNDDSSALDSNLIAVIGIFIILLLLN